MKMQLAEIAQALNTSCEGDAETVITSVAFDSRKISQGALFIPIKGERDGHDFVGSAIEAGASATLWEAGNPNKPEGIAVLEVADTLKAMQDLARYYLQKVNPTVVSITGSNGKTTTKDMVAAVLAKRFNVYKTQANFNNEIGVPMTILEMKPITEILVLEMGMDRAGQLHELSQLARPDVAVITMIGEAHIEFFGSRDKIADAKMESRTFCKKTANLSTTVMNPSWRKEPQSFPRTSPPSVSRTLTAFMPVTSAAPCTIPSSRLTGLTGNSQFQ